MYDLERDFRRELICIALEEAAGHRTLAAAALGIERTYLCRLMKGLAIRPRAVTAAASVRRARRR
jgi:DNA-binding NtrC family response regulator